MKDEFVFFFQLGINFLGDAVDEFFLPFDDTVAEDAYLLVVFPEYGDEVVNLQFTD